ncbi:uncharacterized protein LOC141910601 [Tubulanus polymorphus]|uniref:uncharacterized protein LOC141910601 n=1 Tax=Tubulanus polymorphus TaxID=672921 RepID=UPI003DA26FEE
MVTPSATKANCDIAEESRDLIWVIRAKGNNSTETSYPFNRTVYNEFTRQEMALQSNPAVNLTVLCEDTCNLELYKTVDLITKYNGIAAVIAGIIGTVLISITLIPDLKRSSANWFILSLALTETCWLFYKLLTEFEPMYSALRETDSACKFSQIFLQFLEMNSVYILLGMTAERMYVVVAPLKAASTLSMKKSMIITSAITVCILIFSLPLVSVFSYRGNDHLGIPICEATDFYFSWTGVDAYFYLQMALTTFLPIVLLFAMNFVIIFKIQQHSREQATMMTTEGAAGKKSPNRQERQITIMLVTASVVFLVLSLPFAIVSAARNSLNLYVCAQEESYAIMLVVGYVTRNFSHAVNAYIYCLSSRAFRTQLLKRFGIRRDSSRSYVSQTQMTSVSAVTE